MRRRDALKTLCAAAAAGALPVAVEAAQSAAEKPVRIGIVGVGNRGRSLLGNLLKMPHVRIPALCDINKRNLKAAQDMVEESGRPRPEGYSDDEHHYIAMMERDDLDAVVVGTYWQWHTPMAVCAMKNGKYAAVEVPAALSVEECWDLVNTSEETGVPCMMLENWCFRQDNLAVLNMIRQGLLGEIIHCHCAHSHDCIDHWFFDRDGNDRWPAEFLEKYNRDQYPTHSLGPVMSWMDINCGDAFATIASTATSQKGINAYFAREFGKDHPNATKEFAQGDIVTSTVKTHGGKTVVINYDMQLPRPYDNRWTLQGELGVYNEQREAVYLHGVSPEYHEWESFAPYQEKYNSGWWKRGLGRGGHGGVDFMELYLFVEAVRGKTQTPIDVYDSATMSSVVGLSGQSIKDGSVPVEVPDFTRGKWKTRKPSFSL
jgi:predicted dehydrogenase